MAANRVEGHKLARPWSVGSQWARWDPHLHAPGTLLNDGFKNDWSGYIHRIEQATPAARVLGITDYHTLRGYKAVRARRSAGDLQSVELLFPNVELRLTMETKDRAAVNLHLLVSPEDPNHVTLVEEILARLKFRYRDQQFACSDDALRRLGRVFRSDVDMSDDAALEAGANQFKVDLNDLRTHFDTDAWLRHNVIVAVAAGADGLAGLQDASFAAQRQDLGRFAQVIFSANPSDRIFWLGRHKNFESEGQRSKPCLHGSDAHTLDRVLEPDMGRRCWVRGAASFDTLRQTLVEPERRVHIGEHAPRGAYESIRKIIIRNATWIANDEIGLNDGLVSIIGAKGSGKTALADLIAAAAGAAEEDPGLASFVYKAGQLIHGTNVILEWADGTHSEATFPDASWEHRQPRVRYLSQQFVERLCAPAGLAEPLVDEIERVVFDSIPDEDRRLCSSFAELRDLVLAGPLSELASDRHAIQLRTERVAEELATQALVPKLETRAGETARQIKATEMELATAPVNKSDAAKVLQSATIKLQELRTAIARQERRSQQLGDLTGEIQRKVRDTEDFITSVKSGYPDLLDETSWEALKLRVNVDGLVGLSQLEAASIAEGTRLRMHGMQSQNKGLAGLTADYEKSLKDLGLDQTNHKRRLDQEARLAKLRAIDSQMSAQLADARKAGERRKRAQNERLDFYASVFRALVSEQEALDSLYTPLREKLQRTPQLSKLSFDVRRRADLITWMSRGEALLDLRKSPFGSRGELAIHAQELFASWTTGTPEDVKSAMHAFISTHGSAANAALRRDVSAADLGAWLFSTEHISVKYGILYEGVEVGHLSPGTRGVVLLTLYLALDDADQRPLLIDQPEENLDPRTVFSDLVPFFRSAALRRQIIMVTHNANLVVNTDSDQVIVAESERASPKTLPLFTYSAGGLENSEIRTDVCRLLEGGGDAFDKRARRYAIAFQPPKPRV